jgi:glucose-6-phosphate isomerase
MSELAAAWAAFEAAAQPTPVLKRLFADDPDRATRLSVDVAGLFFDFSKLHLSAPLLAAADRLAGAAGFAERRDALFSDGVVNASEARAATHAAERGYGRGAAVAVAQQGQLRQRALVDCVARGDFGDVTDVIHIGIGGSALGPALLLDALGAHAALRTHIVANIDGIALERALSAADPKKTLIVVVSKTFTTLETLTNANSALAWMEAGGVANAKRRFVGVTAAPARAAAWGLAADAILDFAETVGGRYSLWSAVGITAALALGSEAMDALRSGAASMDAHFETAPFASNAPFLAAVADVLYAAALKAETRGVFAYDERLRLLPAFLQQLEMESNGKSVTATGAPLARPSGAITWGGVGTDAQHAVFQLLHQGTHLLPVEFVAVREAGHRLGGDHHRQLIANCIAQGAALMQGRTTEQALALAGGDPALAAAKSFPGNRPSSTILLDRLDAATLGALIAFYEHRTFAAATLIGINPFDQWGVELGKDMARAAASGDTAGGFDPSSAALLKRALTSG